MPKFLGIALMVLFAAVAVAEEPEAVATVTIDLNAEAAIMTPAALDNEPSIAPLYIGGGCSEAGGSCTDDDDCCNELVCADAANPNPNTCTHIVSPIAPPPEGGRPPR